jgi:hypothetical protein
MLVVIAILLGIIVGIIAAVLASVHGPESAVFSGAGVFVAASLFVIKIESTLQLFELAGVNSSIVRGLRDISGRGNRSVAQSARASDYLRELRSGHTEAVVVDIIDRDSWRLDHQVIRGGPTYDRENFLTA